MSGVILVISHFTTSLSLGIISGVDIRTIFDKKLKRNWASCAEKIRLWSSKIDSIKLKSTIN